MKPEDFLEDICSFLSEHQNRKELLKEIVLNCQTETVQPVLSKLRYYFYSRKQFLNSSPNEFVNFFKIFSQNPEVSSLRFINNRCPGPDISEHCHIVKINLEGIDYIDNEKAHTKYPFIFKRGLPYKYSRAFSGSDDTLYDIASDDTFYDISSTVTFVMSPDSHSIEISKPPSPNRPDGCKKSLLAGQIAIELKYEKSKFSVQIIKILSLDFHVSSFRRSIL